MSETAHYQAEYLADARRNHDPTGTGALRRTWRSVSELRLRQLRAQLRIAVVDHDMLGLTAGGFQQYQSVPMRLRGMQDWFERAATTIMEGTWPAPYVKARLSRRPSNLLHQRRGATRDWNPDQPREPAGTSEGGQWAGGGGGWWEPEWGAAAPAPPQELKISDLKKVGPQMGSNIGGVYADASGKKFYIKQGKSADQVRNEMLAARLYRLAGTPTLHYRAVEGGKHIATEIEKLDKKNANALSPEERAEAAKDFAVHAWLDGKPINVMMK